MGVFILMNIMYRYLDTQVGIIVWHVQRPKSQIKKKWRKYFLLEMQSGLNYLLSLINYF